jgi:hypothetical protein
LESIADFKFHKMDALSVVNKLGSNIDKGLTL